LSLRSSVSRTEPSAPTLMMESRSGLPLLMDLIKATCDRES
jgi:hypothetical protein